MAAIRYDADGLLVERLSEDAIKALTERYGPEVSEMCYTDFRRAAYFWHLHQCLRATRGVPSKMPCNSF